MNHFYKLIIVFTLRTRSNILTTVWLFFSLTSSPLNTALVYRCRSSAVERTPNDLPQHTFELSDSTEWIQLSGFNAVYCTKERLSTAGSLAGAEHFRGATSRTQRDCLDKTSNEATFISRKIWRASGRKEVSAVVSFRLDCFSF